MKRLHQLDGIRGCAILLVLVWHYIPCQIQAEPKTILSVLGRVLSLTWSGVDLFFVLSGFLIAGILLDNREAKNYFRVFYIRRTCRIFPLYFLVLGLFLLFTRLDFDKSSFKWLLSDPKPLWSYATFTQNIFMGLGETCGAHWLGMTWSLAVEEQFYIFLPAVVYVMPRSVLPYILGSLIVSAPILRLLSPGFHMFVNAPWRSDSLLLGALLAWFVREPGNLEWCKRRQPQLYCGLGILLFGAAIMTGRRSWFGVFDHSWLAALYALFILLSLVDSEHWPLRFLKHPLLTWFGVMSYGIYMYHQIVSGLLHGIINGAAPAIKNPLDAGITGLALVLTLILATLSYRLIERWIIQYGHKFKYKK